jgi:hypothetical protein
VAILRYVSFDLDLVFPLTGFRDFVGRLHPQKGIHLWAERFLDTDGHLGRKRRVSIEQGGKRGAGNAENLGGVSHREPEGVYHLHPDELPRMGPRAMRTISCRAMPLRLILSFTVVGILFSRLTLVSDKAAADILV